MLDALLAATQGADAQELREVDANRR